MEKYRKPDRYYFDRYDSITIKELKELEANESAELAAISDPIQRQKIHIGHAVGFSSFRNTAIHRARNRDATIRQWMSEHESQDRLVASNPLPANVTCNTCKAAMQFCVHFFDVDSIPLLFIFECTHGHAPRKAIRPDGREYVFPQPSCKKCGYELTVESYKVGNILYTTTTCASCGKVEKDELVLVAAPEVQTIVSEEDRKKYCLSFFNARTFLEDLEAFANLFESIEEEKKEENLWEFYEVDKIEKLNIPALESRLKQAVETVGFIKLSFDRPEMKTWTTITFNLQDPTDRDSKKSVKAATKCIGQSLRFTNWRLTGTLEYRLGYLTGKLKAYERDDDLFKLAKEIKEVKQIK